jgi:hypothetical protein
LDRLESADPFFFRPSFSPELELNSSISISH